MFNEGMLKNVLLRLSGMMLGGGCGRELAHWIIHGRPERDMYGYDIRCVHTLAHANGRLPPAGVPPSASGVKSDPSSVMQSLMMSV